MHTGLKTTKKGGLSVKMRKHLYSGFALLMLGINSAHAEYTLNLTKGVTEISRDLYDLHMLILWICVLIGIAVFGTMFYSIFHHRKSKGHKAAQFHENTTVEIIWTIIPSLILIGMAIPATKALVELDDVQDPDMSIKVTGWQWKWEYEYLDNGIRFFSSLDAASNAARQVGSGIDPRSIPNYLLNVDHPLVIPVKTKIRFLFTAADVIHSWWVPALGWKKDTNPGFVNESWTYVETPGVYRGQCAELCGKDHGFMPIVVIAMEQDEYAQWVAEKQADIAAEISAADKEWTMDELVAEGKSVYASNCSSCHMPDGAGMPGTFPAITKSAVVTGDLDSQISLMMDGKGMMPAFGSMLSAVDFAAVATYIRNDLGNSVGDSIQPKVIQSLQADKATDEDDEE